MGSSRILGGALVFTALVLSRPAGAQMSTASMRDAMHVYFEGEKREAWAFGAAGLVTTGGGTAMLFAEEDFYRGAAPPLIIVGAIQLVAGIVLLARTDAQVRNLDARLDIGKRAFLDLEQPRMRKVQTEFRIIAGVELALLVAGLGLATYGGAQGDHQLAGIGTATALQSAAMFTFDVHASARADVYSAAIAAFAH